MRLSIQAVYHTQFPSLFIMSVIITHLKQWVINEHRLVMQIQRRLKKIFCSPFLTPFVSHVDRGCCDGSVQAQFSIRIFSNSQAILIDLSMLCTCSDSRPLFLLA
jgi:hypothetical protein